MCPQRIGWQWTGWSGWVVGGDKQFISCLPRHQETVVIVAAAAAGGHQWGECGSLWWSHWWLEYECSSAWNRRRPPHVVTPSNSLETIISYTCFEHWCHTSWVWTEHAWTLDQLSTGNVLYLNEIIWLAHVEAQFVCWFCILPWRN